MKALKAAAARLGNVRAFRAWVDEQTLDSVDKLKDLIDALPDDGVVVTRAQLARWAEAAMDATSGSAIKGDGYMFDDERRALYAIDTEIQALLKGSP